VTPGKRFSRCFHATRFTSALPVLARCLRAFYAFHWAEAIRRIAATPLVLRNALGKTISHGGMRFPNYKRFFIAATAGNTPFDYRCRLACGERDNQLEDQWLASGARNAPGLIAIPTGCGKTAAAILAWLWNRLIPTGLAAWYCLPMRAPSFSFKTSPRS
jgi:hypothetical protein